MLVAKTNEENRRKRWTGGQDMPDFKTSREEKTLIFFAQNLCKGDPEKKDSIVCVCKKGQHCVRLYMENARRKHEWWEENAGRGGQDMPDFERSRAEKNSSLFSPNLWKDDPEKKDSILCFCMCLNARDFG